MDQRPGISALGILAIGGGCALLWLVVMGGLFLVLHA